MAYTNNTCLRYFSPKNGEGIPTAGVLMGYLPNNLPCNAICDMIELFPYQMTIPNGTKRCHLPNGLRVFYRINRFGNPKTIQPNSVVYGYDFPKTPNDCQWLEWYRIC